MAIKLVGVVGAGTMGWGIALLFLRHGLNVSITDQSSTSLKQAQENIWAYLDKDAEKGKLTDQQLQDAKARLHLVDRLEKFADCDAVIEAVSENVELKKQLFAALTEICRTEALLLTNTSSLTITEIAGGLKRADRIVGLHFFNPAPVMPLVEVIRGKQSSEVSVQRVYEFALELGKTPIVVKDSPGFVVNRVARPFYNESLRIYGDGIADVAEIDRILKLAGGFRMGPFELQDMIGIDINFAATTSVYGQFFQESRFKPSRIQQQMVQSGTLGRKTGEGYYRYDE